MVRAHGTLALTEGGLGERPITRLAPTAPPKASTHSGQNSHDCELTPPSSKMANWVPEVEYLSTGANRHGAVADWSVDGILAFGADTNVALWKPEVSEQPLPNAKKRSLMG